MNAHKQSSPNGSGFVRREDSKLYKAGHPVPATGLYEIIHHGRYCQAHEVVLICGDRIPGCEGCGEDVRFRLLRIVPYIFHDEDFAIAA